MANTNLSQFSCNSFSYTTCAQSRPPVKPLAPFALTANSDTLQFVLFSCVYVWRVRWEKFHVILLNYNGDAMRLGFCNLERLQQPPKASLVVKIIDKVEFLDQPRTRVCIFYYCYYAVACCVVQSTLC